MELYFIKGGTHMNHQPLPCIQFNATIWKRNPYFKKLPFYDQTFIPNTKLTITNFHGTGSKALSECHSNPLKLDILNAEKQHYPGLLTFIKGYSDSKLKVMEVEMSLNLTIDNPRSLLYYRQVLAVAHGSRRFSN